MAGVLAVVAIAVTVGVARAPETLTRDSWTGPATGVFRGTSEDEIRAYEEWLGSPVAVVVDFSARSNWYEIAEPDYLLEEWRGTDRRLVLSVPMLPTDVAGTTIAAGADGEYDDYFRTLGEKLVDHDLADSILRIGWEFNIASWPWHTEVAGDWTEYFRRIVDQFRDVEGQAFRFDWNVNNGPGPVDAVDFYPGDDYVDFVGVDAYDIAGVEGGYPPPDGCTDACLQDLRVRVWNDLIHGGERGLRFWSDFAKDHDKQMSLPEWGLWDRFDGTGGGDNPYYIEQMAAFIADPDNAVAYQAYFENANDTGTHRLMTDLTDSGARFRELLGG
ncbi:UNVERIFIED_ORG: hypothetical protein E4P37_19135 [Bacillus sp. AZ43]